MALQLEDIPDLVIGIQKRLGPGKFNQIAQNSTEYEVMGRLMRRGQVEFEPSGIGIRRNLMLDTVNSFRWKGMDTQDVVNIADVMTTMEVPWRFADTHVGWDVRELLAARGDSKLLDIVKVREVASQISCAEGLDDGFFTKPADSSDDKKPFGLPYWAVKNDTEGFTGADPAGFSAGAGGIQTSGKPKWKNYSAKYASITKADLLKKMKKFKRLSKFKSPVDVPDYRKGRGDQFRLYTNDTIIESLEDVAESQNENLGRDLYSMEGQTMFGGNPLVYAAELDGDSSNPIYMLNWAFFHLVFLKGNYALRYKPERAKDDHTKLVQWIDYQLQMYCSDRRRQAVFHTGV